MVNSISLSDATLEGRCQRLPKTARAGRPVEATLSTGPVGPGVISQTASRGPGNPLALWLNSDNVQQSP